MAYNPNDVECIEKASPGTTVKGVIIEIIDGVVRDFVTGDRQLEKFSNPDSKAIELIIEFKHRERAFRIKQLLTYLQDDKGKTLYTPKSNFGKYIDMYGVPPKVEQIVNLQCNKDGYFRLMI